MPDKELLELYPLYKKKRIDLLEKFAGMGVRKYLAKPAINYYCPICGSNQTFNMISGYDEYQSEYSNHIYNVVYQCASCSTHLIHFSLHIYEEQELDPEDSKNKIRVVYSKKIGQFPAWSIELDKELEGLLGDNSELYRKGLICESQSYGIGAYAYFRRISEAIIDQLLDSVEELVSKEDKAEYRKALSETKKTRIAEKKIELIKDLLPSELMPGGMNPLKALYDALSNGLHGLSDEECMDKAEAIRNVLIFLVNRIEHNKNVNLSFTNGMKKILSKNTSKK